MVYKIVIITGPRAEYGFCPVPPLNNSAPERNVFRLVEHINDPGIQVYVVSACSKTQQKSLLSARECYINIPFPANSLQVSKFLNNRIMSSIYSYFLKTHDLFSWIYLNKVSREVKRINPEKIIINSQPQFIKKIRLMFPSKKIGLFQRGEMGSSRRYLSALDFIITNSDGITKYVSNLLQNAQVPIYKIPNTLDDNYCSTPKQYFAAKRIIYTGRMVPDKGVMELICAFKLVKKKFPDAHLTLVGGNFRKNLLDTYEQNLVNVANAHRLNVEFISQVPNDQLPEYYQQADIAVFPSICLESFGMVALEAMRCGLPVVASRRPGFEELVVPGETGILVDDPQNENELAKAIIDLLQRPHLIQKFGEAGHKRSFDYTPQKAADSFMEFVNATIR